MTIKEHLYHIIIEKAQNQKKLILLEMEQLKLSALNESKSTAGDKHETGRAMIHNEQEKLSLQMLEIEKQLQLLIRINPQLLSKTIQLGSLVHTDKINFYICTSAGKIVFNAIEYVTISANSPIGIKLMERKVGDSIEINNQRYKVISFC